MELPPLRKSDLLLGCSRGRPAYRINYRKYYRKTYKVQKRQAQEAPPPPFQPRKRHRFSPGSATVSAQEAPPFQPRKRHRFSPRKRHRFSPKEAPPFQPKEAPPFQPKEAPPFQPKEAPPFQPKEAPTRFYGKSTYKVCVLAIWRIRSVQSTLEGAAGSMRRPIGLRVTRGATGFCFSTTSRLFWNFARKARGRL